MSCHADDGCGLVVDDDDDDEVFVPPLVPGLCVRVDEVDVDGVRPTLTLVEAEVDGVDGLRVEEEEEPEDEEDDGGFLVDVLRAVEVVEDDPGFELVLLLLLVVFLDGATEFDPLRVDMIGSLDAIPAVAAFRDDDAADGVDDVLAPTLIRDASRASARCIENSVSPWSKEESGRPTPP